MSEKIIKVSVLISILALVLCSCSKDDNGSSENSTNGKTTAVFNPDVTYGTMTDQDGNIYKTITIVSQSSMSMTKSGTSVTQTWMAENLRTTKYNDGSAISLVTDDAMWTGLSTGGYCNYNNTINADTIVTFGHLYNWYAVNTGKLAPKGWKCLQNNSNCFSNIYEYNQIWLYCNSNMDGREPSNNYI